ncbi:MAG: glycoside hydrolase family 2, partial [Myxococcales bacterium]
MLTRWGRSLDPDAPLPEHPRPQLVRDTEWVNLNGRWDHSFSDTPQEPETWNGTIVVPFSPEAELSGVGRQLQPDEWLFYRRMFDAPTTTGRVLLHFGAVDQSCTVWVNGVEVGSHTGGYLPFTFDITEALQDHNELIVRVRDESEHAPHARGKQRLDNGQIWYTAQSGIWQTVWLEAVPDVYITDLEITPDLRTASFDVVAHTSDGGARRSVVQGEPRLWSPDDPHLQSFEVTVGGDTVRTYAALREFGIRDGRFTLNGETIQHVGVLDQGYWSDGLLTPPSDAAMVHDIATMKELGFNVLRKHVKIEPLRWYHHCDRLGMLVWQDMVNGGGRYRHLVAVRPARKWTPLPDRLYPLFFRSNKAARAEFREEVRRTVRLLRNSPCVALWTPFNEGWGQFDANAIAREVKRLDPGRSVNHASGWVDQGGGDVKSVHCYLQPFAMPRGRRGRVVALSEYGGHNLRVEGHDWSSREFGYRRHATPEAFGEAFAALHRTLASFVPQGLAATVYTQVSDVEDELNGLLTW